MVVSIANLRTLNDACGTAAGDAVLAVTGRRLRQVARTSDTVGRLTGSSFGVVLRHCNRDQLRVVAERFLAASRDGVETDRSMVWPHTAIGSALAPEHGGSAADVLAAAQEAVLSARRSDHAAAVFTPPAGGPSLRSLTAQAAAEIAAALGGNRFRLTFRPAVSALDGQIALHETGLDLLDSDGARIPARHLMPLAEGLGVVRLIDRQRLTLAFDWLAGNPDLVLLTAISPVSAADPRWLARMAAMLAERSDLAGRLTLAVPATTPAEAVEGLAEALRDAGSRLALTGVCAPCDGAADMLVIHPALLEPAHGDRAAIAPVAALAASARAAGRLGMAGPVETAGQAEALRDLGIDCLWGPVFGDFSPEPVAVPAWRLPHRPHGPVASAPAGAGTPLARARAALERGREEVSRRR
jgi:diguanylate cyclase (GGDEF)-like protein